MPFAIPALGAFKFGAFFKRLFTSPVFWALLLVTSVGAGTAYYLKHDKQAAVVEATRAGDQKASTKSHEALEEVNRRVGDREQKYIILHDKTIKDYSNARATLQAQPASDRDAKAPRIIIDTINNLDRMRSARDEDSVPDSPVSAG